MISEKDINTLTKYYCAKTSGERFALAGKQIENEQFEDAYNNIRLGVWLIKDYPDLVSMFIEEVLGSGFIDLLICTSDILLS